MADSLRTEIDKGQNQTPDWATLMNFSKAYQFLDYQDMKIETTISKFTEVLNTYVAFDECLILEANDGKYQIIHSSKTGVGQSVPFMPNLFGNVGSKGQNIFDANQETKIFCQNFFNEKFSDVLCIEIVTVNGPFGLLILGHLNSAVKKFSQLDVFLAQFSVKLLEHAIDASERNENLQARLNFFQRTYTESPVSICTISSDGYFTEINNEFTNTFKYERNDVIGRYVHEFIPSHETLFEKVKISNVRKIPVDFLDANGTSIRCEISSILDSSEANPSSNILFVVENVQDRHDAYEKIKRQNKELEETNNGLKQFSLTASHDLSGPLRRIKFLSKTVKEDYSEYLDEKGSMYLDKMVGSSDRLEKLIADLIEYSQTSQSNFTPQKLQLDAIIDEVILLKSDVIEEKSAQISYSELPAVYGDKTALLHLFLNLISNALKYVEDNTAPIVTISTAIDSEKVQIFIIDNGIGISEFKDGSIFEPFVRLHRHEEYTGSGIGLAACKVICDRHGWSIKYTSKQNHGTKFILTLPVLNEA